MIQSPQQHQQKQLIKKLDTIIILGAIIIITTWLTFFWTIYGTPGLIKSSTKKIISAQDLTSTKLNNITTKLAEIRKVLNMCEEFPPPDPVRKARIDAELRGEFNEFPSTEEMIKQLEADG